MRRLWTWGGVTFGYRMKSDLWLYDGTHVGQFLGEEVYGLEGSYLGEILDHERLIVCERKCYFRQHGCERQPAKRGTVFGGKRAACEMLPGHRDFPQPEAIRKWMASQLTGSPS